MDEQYRMCAQLGRVQPSKRASDLHDVSPMSTVWADPSFSLLPTPDHHKPTIILLPSPGTPPSKADPLIHRASFQLSDGAAEGISREVVEVMHHYKLQNGERGTALHDHGSWSTVRSLGVYDGLRAVRKGWVWWDVGVVIRGSERKVRGSFEGWDGYNRQLDMLGFHCSAMRSVASHHSPPMKEPPFEHHAMHHPSPISQSPAHVSAILIIRSTNRISISLQPQIQSPGNEVRPP